MKRMTEELREAKQFEYKFQALQFSEVSLKNENKKLYERLQEKMVKEAESGASKEAQMEM